MGGVDRHDQLRLQSYSIQRARKFVKNYKSLFLGLVDMAIVNSFIVHKLMAKALKKPCLSHYAFMRLLHTQLIGLEEPSAQPPSNEATNEAATRSFYDHIPIRSNKRKGGHGGTVQRYSCKVCSISRAKGAPRGYDTPFHCGKCSQKYHGTDIICFNMDITMSFR